MDVVPGASAAISQAWCIFNLIEFNFLQLLHLYYKYICVGWIGWTSKNNLLLFIIFSVLSSDFIPEHLKLVDFLRGMLQLSLPFALLLLTSLY